MVELNKTTRSKYYYITGMVGVFESQTLSVALVMVFSQRAR